MIKKLNLKKIQLSKRLKAIIAAVLALVLLVGAVLAIEFWPEKKPEANASSNVASVESDEVQNDIGYVNVFSYKKNQVRDAVIKNEHGTITLKNIGEKKFQVKGAEEFTVNESAIDSFLDSAMELPATKFIAENPDNLELYEFSDKSITVELNYSTGEKINLVLGGLNSAGSRYVYYKQNDKLYLVESGWDDPFEKKMTGYLDLSISDGIASDDEGNDIDPHVTKISYTGKGIKYPIVVEENPEYVAELKAIEEGKDVSGTVSKTQFIFTSPMKVDISDDAFAGKQNDYFGISASDIYALRPTAADKKKCGLDDPFVTIDVTATKRNLKIKLGHVVEVDGAYYYYAMSNEREPIFLVDAMDFTFFDEDLINYMSSIVVNVMIDEIDTLTIETKDKKYVFETNGEGDDLVVRWEGKKMSTQEYRDLYTLVMLIYCEESVEPGEYKGAGDVKITYTYREREKVDVIEYVKAGTRKYLIRLNGSDLALVRSKYVDTLVYGAEAFIQGKDVPSDY